MTDSRATVVRHFTELADKYHEYAKAAEAGDSRRPSDAELYRDIMEIALFLVTWFEKAYGTGSETMEAEVPEG